MCQHSNGILQLFGIHELEALNPNLLLHNLVNLRPCLVLGGAGSTHRSSLRYCGHHQLSMKEET